MRRADLIVFQLEGDVDHVADVVENPDGHGEAEEGDKQVQQQEDQFQHID